MSGISKHVLAGRVPLAAVTTVLALGMTFAAETRVALPSGFSLTSGEGVATTRGRHALTISEPGATSRSRVMQVSATGTVFTDLEGVANWVQYSADRSHLLVRQGLPEDDTRRGTDLYSVIDNAGQVVWSTASKAAYRFTAGGNLLYVAQFPGNTPHIRVFDLRGNLIRAVESRRPYLDAMVLEGGEEALVLFSGPGSRSTDTLGGREVAVARVRLDKAMTVVWNVPLDPATLKYPEMIPVDRDWLLITTRQGFVGVNRDGETTRYGADAESIKIAGDANLANMQRAAGFRPGSVILYDRDRTLIMDLAAGSLAELEADPNSRFEDVSYRDRHAVLTRPGEVILTPLEEHGVSGPAARVERFVGKKGRGAREKR